MTDSTDPKAPKSSRKKPAREPATIDLKATVVHEGSRPEDARPEERTPAAAERVAEEAASKPSRSVDSGLGTDSIEAGASPQDSPSQGAASHSQDTASHSQDTASQENVFQEAFTKDAPPRAAPARRSRLGAMIGSGVVGGLVGAGLVYGLQQAWQTPPAQDDSRLAQLEQRVGALSQQGNVQGNTQPLDDRIRTLESARASVDQRLQAVQSTAEKAAAQAEQALNQPASPASPAPQSDEALTELSTRLSALENQLRTDTQAAANTVEAVDSRVTDQDRRLAEQEQRVSTLSRQLAESQDNATQPAIRVILAERLSDALRNGEPYADVLTALKKVENDASRLAPLEPYAGQGAPTASELAQSFKPLSAAILRDERAASGDWTDRLLRMTDRIMTIRPVNEPGSTSAAGLVARIEQALSRGDVADAVAAWEALPEPSRRISEDWGRQAKARAQADAASRAIATDALAALNRTTQ